MEEEIGWSYLKYRHEVGLVVVVVVVAAVVSAVVDAVTFLVFVVRIGFVTRAGMTSLRRQMGTYGSVWSDCHQRIHE